MIFFCWIYVHVIDESYEQLKKQSFFHLRFFFLILMTSSHQPCEWNVITPAICIYVCLSGNFIFLFLFSLVTLSGTNVKGMFCFQKVSCSFYLISAFLLLPQFHFHEWNWLYYFTKQKIWRSWYISYWSNAM